MLWNPNEPQHKLLRTKELQEGGRHDELRLLFDRRSGYYVVERWTRTARVPSLRDSDASALFDMAKEEGPRTHVQYIIVTGNPVDGFQHIGPYTDHELADHDAQDLDHEWWIIELTAPERN